MSRYDRAINWASTNDEPAEKTSWVQKYLGFGKFQLFSAFVLLFGVTSGNYIVFNLCFLELMPKFKCTYKDIDGVEYHKNTLF